MRVHTKQEMLEHALRESLAEGKWKPGDKIPSETELVQQYHVSRTLVRNVLATLIHDGLIESIHGKGSFVLPKKIHAHAPYKQRIRDQLEQRGYLTENKVLEFKRVIATPKLASLLQTTEGSGIYFHRHIRFVGGQPFAISDSFLPERLFPDFESRDVYDTALQDILESYGYQIASTNEFLEIAFASSKVAEQLEVSAGYPLLSLEQLNYSRDDTPYEINRILFRGDRIRLHFDYNR